MPSGPRGPIGESKAVTGAVGWQGGLLAPGSAKAPLPASSLHPRRLPGFPGEGQKIPGDGALTAMVPGHGG